MKKSVSKRIKIKKNGKIIRRSMAIDHFRTRKSKRNLSRKKRMLSLNFPKKRILNY